LPPLLSRTESTIHECMRRMCAGLRTLLLVAVAFMVAVHPLVRSLATLPQFSSHAADSQVVICTAHGTIVIDEPLGIPQPAKQNPSCPWCAIAGGAAGKLPALTSEQLCVFEPRQLEHPFAVARSISPSGPADWPAHPPRGPPLAISV